MKSLNFLSKFRVENILLSKLLNSQRVLEVKAIGRSPFGPSVKTKSVAKEVESVVTMNTSSKFG